MSDSSARGTVREWLERAEDAKKDAEVDEEFEEGNSAKSYWIGNCADELAAKLDELEGIVEMIPHNRYHPASPECKPDCCHCKFEAWLGKKEGQ